MSMWDEYCLVCGGPPSVFFDEVVDTEGEEAEKTETELLQPPIVAADFKWLEEFVGISHTEDVIPLGAYNGYGAFSTRSTAHHNMGWDEGKVNNKIFRIGCRNDDIHKNDNDSTGIDEFGGAAKQQELHGYACHSRCFTLLQRELGYTLRYCDVRPLLEDTAIHASNKFAWSDYGGFSEYQDHSFGRETQLVEDGKLWMLEDPTAFSSANARRILELWRPLVQNGFQRPQHVNDGGPNKLAPGNISGNAVNAVEKDVKMIPKPAIHCESVGVVNADETRDIEVTIPIPKHDIPFDSIGAEINADVDIKIVPKLDIHCKRMGATNTDDVDTKISPEFIDGPTLEFGECSHTHD